jgi:cell division septal protein FtsQ
MKYKRPKRRYKRIVLRSKIKKQRRRSVLKLGSAVLILALSGFLALRGYKSIHAFLFTSKFFKISKIEIKGAKNISQGEIVAILPFRAGDSIFSISLKKTEKRLENYKPELESVRIKRNLQDIVVRVKEREPVACQVLSGAKMGIDASNTVFPLRGSFVTMGLPEFVAENAQKRKLLLDFMAELGSQAKEILPRVKKFQIESVSDVVLCLDDGSKIVWGPLEKEKIKPKLNVLKQVIADAKNRFNSFEYINLCYFDDGRVLLKPKNSLKKI